MSAFSTLTFNVLVGSPLPSFFVRHYIPVLGSRKGKLRLDLQQNQLAEIGADIIALQELHDDRVTTSYATAFSNSHLLIYGDHFNWRGTLMLTTLISLVACFLWLSFICLLGIGSFSLLAFLTFLFPKEIDEQVATELFGVQSFNLQSFISNLLSTFGIPIAIVSVVIAISIAIFCDLVAISFFTGRTHGGLGLLVNKKKFRIIAHETKTHTSQQGDVLNIFKPRAFQMLLVEVLENPDIERKPSSSILPPPNFLFIMNAHTNLGKDSHRSLQFDEIVDATSHSSIAAFCARAGVRHCVPENIPVLLFGDLNAESHSLSVIRLLEKGQFVDTFADYQKISSEKTRILGPALTWDSENPLTTSFNVEHDKRIDYILVRKNKASFLKMENVSIVCCKPPFTSDHYGVYAEFTASSTGRTISVNSNVIARVDDMNPRNTASGCSTPVGGPSSRSSDPDLSDD
jgi:endonuclease/exonuclease/phosphatase family metal-dependent hydrolase